MPQFDTSFYASIIFWLLFGFGVCILFIKDYFLPRFQMFNNQRHDVIEAKKNMYQGKLHLTSTLIAQYRKELKDIKDDHSKILEEKIQELRAKHQEKIRSLEQKLEQERLQMTMLWEKDLKKIESDILKFIPEHASTIQKKFKTSLEDMQCPL